MAKNLSPLRYPGGKSVLYPYIKDIVVCNALHSYTYVELFAGGAGVALALLLNNNVKSIVINDFDYCIYSFWYSVLNETDNLCRMINDTPITIEERLRQRNIYDNSRDSAILSVGFATLFLNRTNRSGILSGGVIGGNEQNGNYKIDCRFNKPELIERIKRIAAQRNKIALYNLDASVLLQTQTDVMSKWCFFYLDPPYVVKGGNLYKNAFDHNEHRQLSQVVTEKLSRRKWLMTYDKVPLIEELYQRFDMEPYSLSYVANEKKQGSELMVFSRSINIPRRDIINNRGGR
ncbi:DNA methyltransferase [Synergistales bacterium]|nr:DNA methyltransferase [Synergistales bacterium]